MILADDGEINRIEQIFLKEFTWITMEHNNKLLFQVDEDAAVLPEGDRQVFHSVVAKLLYLSKRTRPDILTAVSFLCTRVTKATIEDKKKLEYLLGYLQATKHEVLRLQPSGVLKIEAYVDAAFAPHVDSKSHTGVAIFIGGALVFAASKKQKCVTKSPTESELVTLTDNIGFIELFEEFFSFIINREEKIPPLIYQDSTSVISLVTKGGGIVRTKHRVRMNLCKEAVEEKRIRITYIHTTKMLADGLTKPLDGKAFQDFMKALLGLKKQELDTSSSKVLSYPASTCPNRGLGIMSYAESKRVVKNILERKVKRKTKLYLI